MQGQVGHDDDPADLIDLGVYRLENKQVFNETVTLNDLRIIVQAMSEILVNYKLFSVSLSRLRA